MEYTCMNEREDSRMATMQGVEVAKTLPEVNLPSLIGKAEAAEHFPEVQAISEVKAGLWTGHASECPGAPDHEGPQKDYVLRFGLWEEHVDNQWHGGVATIECSPGGEVWGVVWSISNDHLLSLDEQEGVNQGMYSPLEVTVETDNGLMQCRAYQMNHFHACPPSPHYKQVVCLGAKQNGLPAEYLKGLEAVKTNNYSGPSVLDKIKTVMK
ncbi:gamma-glutamylcyclotransferase a isoform X1 [Lampris incognitus]|uniref:gamma-glutamylcyclotransferase a isoform X1 n=1 Tax=Lampris incognitus TaxID=2546036 RepID=UPI0024B4BFFE|nr:gamma-glutamylcyclotransferase a isoform X1 [Lampris incognitus]